MPANNHPRNLPAESVWLGHWIIFAAACNIAGWGLSAIHQLNTTGLLLAIPAVWLILTRLCGLGAPSVPSFGAIRRHAAGFRKVLPLSFALLAALALLGGLIYPPNNLDALIYRLPRVCHWLMEERWEWIVTIKNNLNTRSAGMEWWMASMISILRTDRLIFLQNWVSFLFLPGLVFGLFRGMGARNRVAAVWMWIIPAGHCFIMQAGSIGNDMLTAFFALAAFDYGFRWKRGGSGQALALSLISCAMMTAVKPVTLPLLLPYAVLFFGFWRPLVARPIHSILLAGLLIFASFLPTAAINIHYCGDWTGAAAEDQKLGQVEPLVGIATNSVNTVLQNLSPPVFPFASAWNRFAKENMPASWIEANYRSFETGGAEFSLPDFMGEELCGLGIGVTLLLVISLLLGFKRKTSPTAATASHLPRLLMASLFTFALLAYFSKAGMSTVARHIAPFYPFFLALILAGPRQALVTRMPVWRWACGLALLSAFAVVVIVPSRPLWPAKTLLNQVGKDSHPLLIRAKSGYSVYQNRADGLGPLRDALPPDASRVAYLSFGVSSELPLWKPYLRRSLRHVMPSESLGDLRAEGLRYLILNNEGFEECRGIAPAAWVEQDDGKITSRISLQLLARKPPSEWWVVEIPIANP
jgi:hypothetical protein